jgi:hypothetical protein
MNKTRISMLPDLGSPLGLRHKKRAPKPEAKEVLREWKRWRILRVDGALKVECCRSMGGYKPELSGWLDHCERDAMPPYVRKALKELA